jgi:multicomponent Na+:H+ antiporter subunit D
MAAGAIIYKVGGQQLTDLKGIFHKMPVTMTAFMVGALSMIGVPPTAGFFSKWYLILGGIQAARWEFVGALLFSSLVNAVLFFRIIEIGYFEAPEDKGVNEAPLSMLAPLVVTAISLIVVGIYSGDIVSTVIQYAVPEGI